MMRAINTLSIGSCALFSLLFCGPASHAATQVTVMPPTLVQINYGDSTLDVNVAPAYDKANLLQVQYVPSPSCPAVPQVSLQVRYQGEALWSQTTVEQGNAFRHRGWGLSAIRLLFRQMSYSMVTCQLSVVGQMDSLVSAEATYVGVLSYDGGFKNRIPFLMNNYYTFNEVEFRIPPFCRDITLLEVGSYSGGQFFWARAQGGSQPFHRYDQIQGANQLVVSLNGPLGSRCDIPVYVSLR
jgi:hypothetical protein